MGGFDASFLSIRLTFSLLGFPSLIVLAALTVVFWKYRNKYPIKGRIPWLVVLQNVVSILLILIITIHNLTIDEPNSCQWHFVQRVLFIAVGTVIYLVRGSVLVAEFEIAAANGTLTERRRSSEEQFAEEQARRKQAKRSDSNSHSTSMSVVTFIPPPLLSQPSVRRAHRLRRLLSPRWLAPLIVGAVVVLAIPTFVFLILREPSHDGGRCEYEPVDVYATVLDFVSVVAFLALAYRVREVVEGFYIKRELFLTAGAMALVVVIWCVFTLPPGTLRRQSFPFRDLLNLILLDIIGAFSCAYPLYLHKVDASQFQHLHDPEALDRLESLLTIPEAREAFKEAIASEYSGQNLDFVDEVDMFYRSVERAVERKHGKRSAASSVVRSLTHSKALTDVDDSSLYVSVQSSDEDEKDITPSTKGTPSHSLMPPSSAHSSVVRSEPAGSMQSVTVKAVDLLSDNTRRRLWLAARDLYDTFVRENAALELNLPYEAKQQLAVVFGDTGGTSPDGTNRGFMFSEVPMNDLTTPLTATDDESWLDGIDARANMFEVFDVARTEIMMLMSQDTFSRFKRTAIYKELQGKIKDTYVRRHSDVTRLRHLSRVHHSLVGSQQ